MVYIHPSIPVLNLNAAQIHMHIASDAELWFFMYAWTNGWTSNGGTSDLRRQRAHYDVNGMSYDSRHCVGSNS